jgi:hypothetical protein
MSFFYINLKNRLIANLFVKDNISHESRLSQRRFFIAFFVYNFLRVFYKISQEESYYFHIGVPYFPMGMVVFP